LFPRRKLVCFRGLLRGWWRLCAGGDGSDIAEVQGWFGAELGVAAMAVRTALVQLSIKGAPPTEVMTTNITRFIMDTLEEIG
jgi:hypothetical protein